MGNRAHTNSLRQDSTPSGHIALQQYSPETVIEFRKIEIKELDRSNQKDSKEVGRFLGTTDRVQRVAFSPDGLGILSGGFPSKFTIRTGGSVWFTGPNYVLRLWEVASGRNLFTMEGEGVGVAGFALSSDGRYAASCESLVSANPTNPILIWDLKTGLRIHELLRKMQSMKRGALLCLFLRTIVVSWPR